VFLLESLETPIPTLPLFVLFEVPRIILCPGYVLIRETFGLFAVVPDVYGCVLRLLLSLLFELLPLEPLSIPKRLGIRSIVSF